MDVIYPIEYFNLRLLMGHGSPYGMVGFKMNSKVDSRFQDDRKKRNTISYEMKYACWVCVINKSLSN